MKHRYLFILEVAPIKIGKVYHELPSHLTLMSRFFSDLSPRQIDKRVRPLLEQQESIGLIFGETAELGPKKLLVHLVKHTDSLKRLHNVLRTQLDSIHVEYEYPQFIGSNHKPHVTKREGVQFTVGNKKTAQAVYLVEIVEGKRVIRSRFNLVCSWPAGGQG